MTSGGLSSVLAAYDQCVISLAIGYGVSWIHYSMLYGIMINPSMLDVPFTNDSTSVEHVGQKRTMGTYSLDWSLKKP